MDEVCKTPQSEALVDTYDFIAERDTFHFDVDEINKAPFQPDPILSEPDVLPPDSLVVQPIPRIHPTTKEKLFPITSEDAFGRKRKRSAGCWKEYEIFKNLSGELFAICSHCKSAAYRAESKFGTSNITRHLEGCSELKKKAPSPTVRIKEFDQRVYCELMADAIMMHGYPFSFVEHEGVRKLHKYLNEDVKTVSRNTIQKVCILKHDQFKEKIKKTLRSLSSRLCFTCDIWTACTSRSYFTLTVHFVDDDWKLRSKVLNFIHFPPPHNGLELYNTLFKLLKEWGIEDKVFTVTVDNATSMDKMMKNLKLALIEHLPDNGTHSHIRCSAHILNLIVKDGMKIIEDAVVKIRENVKYIDASEARLIKFYNCAESVFLPHNTKLWLDVDTRWNSTYLMLKRALFYRKAVDMFGLNEPKFLFRLSCAEWVQVEKICKLLEPFYEITTLFSGSDYPTANLYFYNVWKIEKLLKEAKACGDTLISKMAVEMHGKFTKYWDEYSNVLSFAVILDPRYKFDFVEFSFIKLHEKVPGLAKAKLVSAAFVTLFNHYQGLSSSTSSATAFISSGAEFGSENNDLEEFEACYGSAGGIGKSEYERYLLLAKEPRSSDFDILSYWKKNAKCFPILSSMAKDILAIPITSVASESTFSMGGRVLNKWRSSLLSKNVEALITTRNWLFGYEDMDAQGVEIGTSNSSDEE